MRFYQLVCWLPPRCQAPSVLSSLYASDHVAIRTCEAGTLVPVIQMEGSPLPEVSKLASEPKHEVVLLARYVWHLCKLPGLFQPRLPECWVDSA